MSRHKTECFALLPKLTEAMLEFGREYQQRGIPTMCRRYEAEFIADGAPVGDGSFYQSQSAAWIAWDDDAQALRGHLVAFIEPLFDAPVVYVQQLHIASRYVPRAMRDQVLTGVFQRFFKSFISSSSFKEQWINITSIILNYFVYHHN